MTCTNFILVNFFSNWYCNGNVSPHNWSLWFSYFIILVQCIFKWIFESMVIPAPSHNKFVHNMTDLCILLLYWQVLLQVWQPPSFSVCCHPFQFSIWSSSPKSVALLPPLPRLLLISLWLLSGINYPLSLMCPSHFFFLFFNVFNNSLSTPISCSTLYVYLKWNHKNCLEVPFKVAASGREITPCLNVVE